MKTADTIILYLGKNKQMTKIKIAKELGVSRPTLDAKLRSNDFMPNEVRRLRQLEIV